MDGYQILTLLAFLFPLAYSPGPGNMFFAANGARFGWRATLAATSGYHIATLLVTVLIGLGFAAALTTAPRLLLAIKVAGALYVLWLAWQLWRSGRLVEQSARPAGFMDGVVLLLLNPKAYLIIGLMFSQFLVPDSGTYDVLVIAVVFTLNNLLAFSVWTGVGDRLAQRFRSQAQARVLNTGLASMLAGVAIWMLVA